MLKYDKTFSSYKKFETFIQKFDKKSAITARFLINRHQKTKILKYTEILINRFDNIKIEVVPSNNYRQNIKVVFFIRNDNLKLKELLLNVINLYKKEMASILAHQYRQPLQIISAAAINLSVSSELETLSKERIKQDCTLIQRQAFALSQTVEKLKSIQYSKNIFLDEIINDILFLIKAQFNNRGITYSIKSQRTALKTNIAFLETALFFILFFIRDNLKNSQKKFFELNIYENKKEAIVKFNLNFDINDNINSTYYIHAKKIIHDLLNGELISKKNEMILTLKKTYE